MVNHDLHLIRNTGIMAHIDAGKMITSERTLFYIGRTHRVGEVHDGATIIDWVTQEQGRGIIITSAAIICNRNYLDKLHKINLIDISGHVDFTAEVERSPRVLDGAVATYSAADGVQPQSEIIRRQADKYNVLRIGYINKMNRSGADLYETVQQMKNILGANPIVIQTPIGTEENSKGAADLIKMRAILQYDETIGAQYDVEEVPAGLADETAERREGLPRGATNYDDELMEMHLEGQDIPEDKLIVAIHKGYTAMECCPMLLGSSHKSEGVQPLLDYVCVFLSSPLNTPATAGINPDTEEEEGRESSESKPISALVFKIATGPFMGRLVLSRAYSGKVIAGFYVFNTRSGKKERIGRLLQMNSNKEIPTKSIDAGDIGAGVGFKDTRTGDALCDESAPATLESITFPDTIIPIVAEPKNQVDATKLNNGFFKFVEGDPVLIVRTGEQSGQVTISGMDELHSDITVDRLKREFKVECNQSRPQVNYKEVITKVAQSRETYKKQSGGRGKFACIDAATEPKDGDHGEGDLQFVDVVGGGDVPKEFTSAVEEGFKDCLGNGVLGGFPMTGPKVTLTDGSLHPADSDQLLFGLVAYQAFKVLCSKIDPVLVEPIIKVEIVTPGENMGDVTGGLNKHRGLVQGMDEAHSSAYTVKITVPLSEMFDRITVLRTTISGRATSSMEYDHHSPVSNTPAKEIPNGLKDNPDFAK